jgi:proteasome lid subunit RPN8/RPN11
MAVTTSVVPEVSPDVLSRIDRHVRSRPGRPVGGLLLGHRGVDVRIEEAIPDMDAVEHHGEIEFSPSVWTSAYARTGEDPARGRLVGWYHSHADGSTSLSGYDRSLHRLMFGEPQAVALVVSPEADAKAWYGWVLGRLSDVAPGPADVIDLSNAPRRRWASAAVAAAVLAAAAGGFAVGAAVRPPGESAKPSGTEDQQQLRSTIGRLRSDLAGSERQRAELQADLAAARAALQKERRRAEAAARHPAFARYRVRRGDTLWQLAGSFYGNPAAWPRIARANGILLPRHIEVGQVLRIPIGR